jgi:hypothetical protein
VCDGTGGTTSSPTPTPTPTPSPSPTPPPIISDEPYDPIDEVEYDEEYEPYEVVEPPTTETIIEIIVNNPTARVNGANVALDQSAVILNGRTVVPLRFIAESLGASVEWISETSTAIITTADTRIEVTVDNPSARVNGASVALDQSATILNGRTVVPVRFIAESLGASVDWDAASQGITIRR